MKKVYCDHCNTELDLKGRPPEKFEIRTDSTDTGVPRRLWTISINASLAIRQAEDNGAWSKVGPVDLCSKCLVILFNAHAANETLQGGEDGE